MTSGLVYRHVLLLLWKGEEVEALTIISSWAFYPEVLIDQEDIMH